MLTKATYKEETGVLKLYDGSKLLDSFKPEEYPKGYKVDAWSTVIYDQEEEKVFLIDDAQESEIPLKFI